MEEKARPIDIDAQIALARHLLSDRNISEVSRRTGISRPTLYNFMRSPDCIFSMATFRTLYKYLTE